MSLLKPDAPAEAAAPTTVPVRVASPAPPSSSSAGADARAAFREAMQRMDDAFTVGLKAAEDRAANAEAALAAVRAQLEQTQATLAEAQRKLEVLRELKSRLEGL